VRKHCVAVFIVLLAMLCIVPYTYANEPIHIRVLGRAVAADVAPMLVDGRVMVPLRYIAEALGLDVAWNENTRTVDITRPEAKIKAPEIFGSQHFKKETKEALDLLQRKHPEGYNMVCAVFISIQEYNIGEASPIAWVQSPLRICFFNSRLDSLPTEERAIYLCHEAAHAALHNTKLMSAITKEDNEVVAWLASYRAAKALGASGLANATRREINKNLP